MRKKHYKLTMMFYLFILTLICSLFFLYHFEKKLGPELIECAENQVEYLESQVVNNSIRKYTLNHNPSYILEKEKNEKGEIVRIQYNTKEMNTTLVNMTKIIEEDLNQMIKGKISNINLNLDTITQDYYEKINNGMIFTVSLGTATGNSLLANLGPKIPLKLKLVDKVITSLETNVKEYGLNNALVEMNIKIICTMVIQMPFLSKKVKIENKVPMMIEILQGNVPEYYGISKNINKQT